MRSILPVVFSFIFVTAFSLGAGRLLRLANKRIWHISFFDRAAKYLPYTGWLCFILFGAAYMFSINFMLPLAATGLAVLAIMSLILLLSLPFSLLVHSLHSKVKPVKREAIDPDKRRFLKTAAAIVPVLTLGTSTDGIASSFDDVRIPEIGFTYKDLPEDLDGFRIWHLSDLHLGYYFQLNNLEELLLRAENKSFDLILITGDVADDLSQLTDSLNLVNQMKTSYSPVVSLGNHEYYRGIKEVRRRIEASPIPLLVNNHFVYKIGNTNLTIAGADDPRRMHSDISQFLTNSISMSMQNAPDNGFKILMSHRPNALNVAGQFGINLVLSGHTHGGQIGFNGQSIFEPIAENAYLWGKYQKGQTKLYTSSGVGHWFPFRLGCPAEAPIITLKKV
jgi:predicted MPP superfamily phosphohydrolase